MRIWSQIFGARAFKISGARTLTILDGKKTSTIRRDFGQFQTLIANISGTEHATDKLKRRYQTQSKVHPIFSVLLKEKIG